MIRQISASAGSGKTYILTRRFLELLQSASPSVSSGGCALGDDSRVYGLADILAATFTNKAAAEMRQRVVYALKEEALAELARGETGGPGLAWTARVLRQFGSLQIRTIDSLLTTLVRLSALELNLPPDFEPSFEASEYFTPVYDGLMDDLSAYPACMPGPASGYDEPDHDVSQGAAGQRPGLAPQDKSQDRTTPLLFHTSDPAVLRAGLAEACRSLLHASDFKGFTARSLIRDQVQDMVERLLKGEPVPVTRAGDIHARINALHAGAVGAATRLLAVLDQERLKPKAPYRAFLERCATTTAYRSVDSVFHNKADLDECLLKASQGMASDRALAAFAKASAALAAHRVALPILRHALQLAPLTALAAEIHARLNAGGGVLVPALRLPGLAAGLLSGDHEVSDALCRLGTRIARLLLDEFQDTGRDQWAAILPLVVECLASGGEFTYVGDVKQAIYGWRGGDARLFDEAVAEPELLAINPKPEYDRLPCNWRSHPLIVEHNNTFFSLLGQRDIARRSLAAMLPGDTPDMLLEEAATGAATIFASAHQDIPESKDWAGDPREHLAEVVIYEVEASKTADVTQLVHDRLRRLLLDELLPEWKYGDIALLVRSGDEAALAASWLTEWGLPLVTENSFLLASHPLVGRLISFLGFLEYPLDDLAFWEFVSGPECLGAFANLTSESLNDWLAGVRLAGLGAPGRDETRPPLYMLFRRDFADAWERFIAPFHLEAGLMSAYDVLKEAVNRFALLERMPAEAPFIRRLLEMAHLAESEGKSSLSAFLAFWRETGTNEKIPLPETMNAVRIMTVHKAKGLEFPVVILPFQHKGRRRDRELTAVSFAGMDILTRTVPELGEPYYRACITDELERLNLLYVAWTRPVYALHAFVTRPRSHPTPLTRVLETLLPLYYDAGGPARLERLTENEKGEEGETQAAQPPVGGHGGRISPALQPYPGAPPLPWRPMSWLPGLKIFRSPLRAPLFSASQRGVLAHLCLEHLHLTPGATDYRAEAGRAVRQALRLFPLPVPDPDRIEAELTDSLAWFAALPDVPYWLLHGLREQGIMDETGRLHRVDLVVDRAAPPGQDSPLLVLDYKTGSVAGVGDALPVAEEHARQVRRYMRLLSGATGRETAGLLVYLDERRLVAVTPEARS